MVGEVHALGFEVHATEDERGQGGPVGSGQFKRDRHVAMSALVQDDSPGRAGAHLYPHSFPPRAGLPAGGSIAQANKFAVASDSCWHTSPHGCEGLIIIQSCLSCSFG
jgi:hypothetical protein